MDPSCGAGSFLLATADALVARGVPPSTVVTSLAGCDLDGAAVDHCRAAMERWAADHGVPAPDRDLIVGHDPLASATPFTGRADMVVGNPPFLAQRTTDTARGTSGREALRHRFGDLGPYVDSAAAFLLVAEEVLAPGGVAVMLQPQSTLAARDGTAVRTRLLESCDLVALWGDDARHFDAEVDVCAPLLRRRGPESGAASDVVRIHWGSGAVRVGQAALPSVGAAWAPLLAAALGVPGTDGHRGAAGSVPQAVVGDVATATAGFRDEFYALAAAAVGADDPGWRAASRPLVTVGMIDVCRLDLESPRRLAGRTVVGPRLDESSLEAAAPRVARWAASRRVPKVLVATQTRVVEAVADPTGELVPVTPVVSVEPTPDSDVGVWDLLAAVCSPVAAATAAREHAGSGLSAGSFRVSAASVCRLPLPSDRSEWVRGAATARRLGSVGSSGRRDLLREFAVTMNAAHGIDDPALVEWWLLGADRTGRAARAEGA